MAAACLCCWVSAVSFLLWTGDSVARCLPPPELCPAAELKLAIWLSTLASTPAAASSVALFSAVFDLVYWD